MKIEDSQYVQEVLEGLAKNTQINIKVTLKQFMRFINNGAESGFTIDDVIREVKADTKLAQEHIDNFYKWLQNEKVEGYTLREELVNDKGKPLKAAKQSTAHVKAYGFLRGFFGNLGVAFERKWKRSVPKLEQIKEALKKDNVYTFYDVDEKTRTIRFNRERMQQFLSNLKPRDVAITLALLSSSQDSGDLFKLNVGDIREQENNRIFWEGKRQKTKVLFRTFLSKEAARFIRRYIQQERKDSKNEDPLFVYTRYGKEKRMTPDNIASIFRDVARKMGIKWENGEHNPLRPKRMRHLFRTACDTAGITELYTNAYMGHTNHQGQSYSEFSKAVLELEYLRVEPFLTVYGEIEESLEIKQDVAKLERRVVDLNKELGDMKRKLTTWESLTNLTTEEREIIGEMARDYMRRKRQQEIGEIDRERDEERKQIQREQEKSST